MYKKYCSLVNKKWIRIALLFMIAFVFISTFSMLNASCLTRCDINAEEYSEDTSAYYFNNINLTTSDELVSNNLSIYNMDVSESGKVAITLTSIANKCVAVYDENGDFIRAFNFESDGSVFVAWNDENLVLLYVRGDTAFEITLDGELVAVYSFEYDDSVYRTLEEKRIAVNGCLYEIENSSALIKTDSNGNETVIYNSNIPNFGVFFVPALFFLVLFPGLAFIILKPQILLVKERRKAQQREQ